MAYLRRHGGTIEKKKTNVRRGGEEKANCGQALSDPRESSRLGKRELSISRREGGGKKMGVCAPLSARGKDWVSHERSFHTKREKKPGCVPPSLGGLKEEEKKAENESIFGEVGGEEKKRVSHSDRRGGRQPFPKIREGGKEKGEEGREHESFRTGKYGRSLCPKKKSGFFIDQLFPRQKREKGPFIGQGGEGKKEV